MAVDMKDYMGGGRDNNSRFTPPPTPDFIKNFGKKAGLIYLVIALLFITIIARPFVIINSGEVGILVTMGKYEQTPMEPGFHLIIPFVQRVIIVDTKMRIVDYNKEEQAIDRKGITQFSPISVLDSRGLPVEVELTVQYAIKAASAPMAIATLGLNWEDKVINPAARDVVRSVIGNFTAEELPVKRNTIAQLITEGLVRAINRIEGQPINLISVQLRNIALPEKVREQIERVQIANQEAEKAKYEVEKAKQVAESRRIEAQGIADAAKIRAEGEAKANELIAKSLNANLIKLKQIEAQQKFNEALSQNRDAKIFLTPGGAVPNIWVDMKGTNEKERISSKEGQ
ncbi:MAG: prohibitin family protein [Campylobacterales bacterium]